MPNYFCRSDTNLTVDLWCVLVPNSFIAQVISALWKNLLIAMHIFLCVRNRFSGWESQPSQITKNEVMNFNSTSSKVWEKRPVSFKKNLAEILDCVLDQNLIVSHQASACHYLKIDIVRQLLKIKVFCE